MKAFMQREFIKNFLKLGNLWLALLLFLMLGGVVSGFFILREGLSLTNLTDEVPWGLWITIDLSSIALSAGAFVLCVIVYLFRIEKFKPLAKTATFIGLIGYSMAMMCLFIDIGRPDRFYGPFVFWNTHSVLWEVSMCIGLYFMVLTFEVMPIIGHLAWVEKKFPKISMWMIKTHDYAPYLAVAGLTLSILHQSSLGSTYGVLIGKPIWYSPNIGVIFMISAMMGGISLTILISMLTARISKNIVVPNEPLFTIGSVLRWGLVFYLYIRLWNLLTMTYTYQPGRAEGLSLFTEGPLAASFWIGELFFGAFIPIIILFHNKLKKNTLAFMIAMAMVVLGVISHRWDTNLAGLITQIPYFGDTSVIKYAAYSPSLIEITTGLGIVAYGALAITIGIRFMNIIDHNKQKTVI